MNQSTNQCINQAINHSSQPSTNLSANQWIHHKSLRNKSTNQSNHQSLYQSTMPFINQTTIKTKRVQTLPGNWVITTHDMISITFPHPTPDNVGLQIWEKLTILFSIVLGGERGRKSRVFKIFACGISLQFFQDCSFQQRSMCIAKTHYQYYWMDLCYPWKRRSHRHTNFQFKVSFPTQSESLKLPYKNLSVFEQD